METKSLLYGLIGFFIGGLLVSVAATTFDKPDMANNEMTMSAMTDSLKGKMGDEYDKAFITSMIAHHDAAVGMAKLSADRANHAEIKDLSQAIILAQQKEINDMKFWQREWGYEMTADHSGMKH